MITHKGWWTMYFCSLKYIFALKTISQFLDWENVSSLLVSLNWQPEKMHRQISCFYLFMCVIKCILKLYNFIYVFFFKCFLKMPAQEKSRIVFLLFNIVRCQMSLQIACLWGCIVTLVTFVWLFSTVSFHMFPQIACMRRCIVALFAFVWLDSTVNFHMCPQSTWEAF